MAAKESPDKPVMKFMIDGIFTNGCVLFLSQGGTLKEEGASKVVSVPFFHRHSMLSALPQHHSGT